MYSNKPIILLKITRKEHIKSIIDEGFFHFTLASYFRENAIANPNSLIYDIDECSYSRLHIVYLENNITKKRAKIFDKDSGHMAHNRNQCLFCTYAPNIKQTFTSWDEKKKCYNMSISKEDIKELCNGNPCNDYGIIIFEFPYKTIDKIDKEFKKRGITGAAGYVQYDDHYFEIKGDPQSLDNCIECAFHKRKNYSNQNEYRIVALNKTTENLTSIRIGQLDDDEFSVHNIETDKDLLVEIHPYINKKFSETAVALSLDYIDVKWV